MVSKRLVAMLQWFPHSLSGVVGKLRHTFNSKEKPSLNAQWTLRWSFLHKSLGFGSAEKVILKCDISNIDG